MSEPIFVPIIRGVIPQGGADLSNTKPARLKRKVKKSLEKAGYTVETVRGVGITFSHYGLRYSEKDGRLSADFCHKGDMPVKATKSKGGGRRRTTKSKKSPLNAGRDPSTSGMSHSEYVKLVFDEFPDEWVNVSDDSGRWVTFDVEFLRLSGKCPTESAKYIIEQTNDVLSVWSGMKYNLLKIQQSLLIGIQS